MVPPFISFVRPTKEDPIVLEVDDHYSHTRSIDIIGLARETRVSTVCIPPHFTDHMQPPDAAFTKSFKTYDAQEIENLSAAHPGRAVAALQIAHLTGQACTKNRNHANSYEWLQSDRNPLL
jgi:hypothetical protein